MIFRERGVDISVPDLVRSITRFINEEEPARDRSLAGQDRPAIQGSAKPNAPATYQVSDQPSPVVREEEFAKHLQIARYLAAASLPPARALEPAVKTRAPKQGRPIRQAGSKAKSKPARQKVGEAELAKERRRAGRVGRPKAASSGPQRIERRRHSPEG